MQPPSPNMITTNNNNLPPLQVGAVTEQDLAELRSYNVPPDRVRLVMMAVCILLDVPTDWRSVQKLLAETNPKVNDFCHY